MDERYKCKFVKGRPPTGFYVYIERKGGYDDEIFNLDYLDPYDENATFNMTIEQGRTLANLILSTIKEFENDEVVVLN